MSYILYVNDTNKRARLHVDGCIWPNQHGCSDGDNDYYKYYSDYDKAWKYMDKLSSRGYDCANCGTCGADLDYDECEN